VTDHRWIKDQTIAERFWKAIYVIAIPIGWYYFFSDNVYRLIHTPLARLTLSDLFDVVWAFLWLLIGWRAVIDCAYEHDPEKWGIRHQAVSQWRHIPAERIIEIETVTGVPREKLRPELYAPRRKSLLR
jgi:hypothetical protein